MSFILLGILNSQVSGAAGGSYDLLESTILSTTASSVTFSGLDSYTDYKHLQIRYTARTNRADYQSRTFIRLNGVTGSTYKSHILNGSGSSVTSTVGAYSDVIDVGSTAWDLPATNASSGNFGAGIIDILDFSDANKTNVIRKFSGVVATGQVNGVQLQSGFETTASALTSIQLYARYSDSWIAGSRFSLYGIRG